MMSSRHNAEWAIESKHQHLAHVVVDVRSGCDGLTEFFAKFELASLETCEGNVKNNI